MTPNPFIRGYRDLYQVRTLLICPEGGAPLWRPLHSSQARLSDEQIVRSPCLFNDEFAVVGEGHVVADELLAQCPSEGLALSVVYSLEGRDFDGSPVHVGDTYTREAARERVRRLGFETGFYSRCWEISTAHLTGQAVDYLCRLADLPVPTGFLFEAFRLPRSGALGVKLLATPWTDEHLQRIEGISAAQMLQQCRERGVLESLLEILHLAALADVRVLIFDADAAVLEGLPLHDV